VADLRVPCEIGDNSMTPKTEETRLRVVAAVVWRDGRLLLTQRPPGGPLGASGSSRAARSSQARRRSRRWCARSAKSCTSAPRRAKCIAVDRHQYTHGLDVGDPLHRLRAGSFELVAGRASTISAGGSWTRSIRRSCWKAIGDSQRAEAQPATSRLVTARRQGRMPAYVDPRRRGHGASGRVRFFTIGWWMIHLLAMAGGVRVGLSQGSLGREEGPAESLRVAPRDAGLSTPPSARHP
jgi:hypothetical protein